MESSRIVLQRALFNPDIVARTAHRYSNRFSIALECTDLELAVFLTPLAGVETPADLEARFLNDALDERLRDTVRTETADIHRDLIQAALREALPRSRAAGA